MYVVCVPSSTPSTGRPKKSYHTFIADVTNAYFHVDEDEERDMDPLAEWVEQQTVLENLTSVLWRLREKLFAGTRWVDLKSKVSTDVAKQHNSFRIVSWQCSLRCTWMISMAPDRDQHWSRSKRSSHRKSSSKSGQ